AAKRSHREKANQGSFQFANVVFTVTCQCQRNIIRQVNILSLGLTLNDDNLRFKVRRFYVRNKAPLKSRMQALFDLWYLPRRTIGREYDLFLPIVQCVEGMKKLLLRSFFARNELHIIN